MEREPTSTETFAPHGAEFRVQLGSFEGPLDLLLHLIKKHELQIVDLPIAFITERYLEYLKLMRELDLDVAAEYLLMAATLAHLKSKMLLPRAPSDQPEENETGEELDPRLELIRRLLEYQKYKLVADDLGSRAIAGRDVFTRGQVGLETDGPAPLASFPTFKLLDAFQAILDRAKDRSALEVTPERISIRERMTQMTELLRERRSCTFEELFEKDVSRYDIVVTFLALLEMTKMHVTRLYQADIQGPIHVQYALLDAGAPTVPPAADVNVTSDDTELAQPELADEPPLPPTDPESPRDEP
jgi:segregation and condensation protein A